MRQTRGSLGRDMLRALGLLLTSDRRQSARLYALLDQRYFFGERTRYLNLGWWDGATNFDDAADALAEQLGLAAGMAEGDTVLDVGFAEAARRWNVLLRGAARAMPDRWLDGVEYVLAWARRPDRASLS